MLFIFIEETFLLLRTKTPAEASRRYENVSPTEAGAGSVHLDQIKPTMDPAGQYQVLNVDKDKAYEEVKVYQQLKV